MAGIALRINITFNILDKKKYNGMANISNFNLHCLYLQYGGLYVDMEL